MKSATSPQVGIYLSRCGLIWSRPLSIKLGKKKGWSLASLGFKADDPDFKWNRLDGSEQVDSSDGFATGYVAYILLSAGGSSDDNKISMALNWLNKNQNENGAWRGMSVNVARNHETHIGQFMDDAATAYAVLALLEARGSGN